MTKLNELNTRLQPPESLTRMTEDELLQYEASLRVLLDQVNQMIATTAELKARNENN